MERVWETLRASLPESERDGELATRFGFLISDMHEANHGLRDAVSKDFRVMRSAQKLDDLLEKRKQREERGAHLVIGQCAECFAINNHEPSCSKRKP